MKVKYANSKLKKSIFLAGPTPRDAVVKSWRPEALDLLENEFKFNGNVYVPETSDGEWKHEYNHQIEWEWEAINLSTVVAFWVPRELETMPAFTTNIEFGYLVSSGKVLLGRPDNAPKTRYLDALAERHNVPIYNTLYDLLDYSVFKTKYLFERN